MLADSFPHPLSNVRQFIYPLLFGAVCHFGNFIYMLGCLVTSSLFLPSGKLMILKVIWLFFIISVEVVIFTAFCAPGESRSLPLYFLVTLLFIRYNSHT